MIYKKLTDFKLNSFYPYVPILNHSVETGGKLGTILNWIDAKVPGSIYHDLFKAGIIKDPYFEMQSMDCEWVADRWWVYKTNFTIDSSLKDRNFRIRLKGIDYKAHINFNDQKLGEHEGMYIPFISDITDIIKSDGVNELKVVLENAPDEMGQIGYTDRTFTQKARFSYKWDWAPRLIHLGLFDDALIEHFGSTAIDYSYIRPVNRNGKYYVDCSFELTSFYDCNITFSLDFGYEKQNLYKEKREFALSMGKNNIEFSFPVDSPKLWYPNGHGEQHLYNVDVTIYDDHIVSDTAEFNVGFRNIEYTQCDGVSEDSLPYKVIINGKAIYLKGVNITPFDSLYGSVSQDFYEKTLLIAKQANINLIRVWGGGLVEKKIFYDLCDKLGLMVWQEFIQSSSGINNVPSKKPMFLKLAEETATETVKVKRNHVCLAFYSGGNELTDEFGKPSTYEDENIKLLKSVVDMYDFDRLMLPTSASGPNEFLQIDQPGKNHDVHGPWKYGGTEMHYTLFNSSDSQLHSEFGVDGNANYECLKRFLSEDNLVCDSMENNIVLRHHGEWWDTYARDSQIFGAFARNELHNFIKCSQFIQGEGIRYASEANRRRAFRSCGTMIWQLNEPWPNASGTNVLDYYLTPKLSYYFLRDSYRPINPTLKYHKLVYNKGEKFEGITYLLNDNEKFEDTLICIAKDANGVIFFEKSINVNVPFNSSSEISDISFDIPFCDSFTVSLTLKEKQISSLYLYLTKDENGFASKKSVCDFYDEYMKNLI